MFNKLMIILAISVPMLFASGCGGPSTDGATWLAETASVSFTTTTVASTSTITAKPNSNDSASTAALAITIQPYPNFTVSPFTVRDMQFTYTQIQGGTNNISVRAANFGAGLSFSPILASGDIMDQLVTLGFVPGTTSLTQPWIFSVQATYTVIEDNSGKSRSYSVPLGTVRFI